ncbi:MAG: lipoyl synthase [Planctomycetes bacterium]|jgi:lipoic acid synthetase|nr:lipoyl synthase [Planctomycetota bacterium]MDP6410824.1 lipoyl synthase [Planctomycetota bacterium]
MSVSSKPITPAFDLVSAPVPPSGQPRRAGRKPSWLKVPLPGGEGYARLKTLTRELELHTVCEQARCPNVGECWSGERATMTLMVLGNECTRRCRFCAVETVDRAAPPDPAEPSRVGRAVAAMGPAYVVITSVDRDDLPDGGAAHYARCVEQIRRSAPGTLVETLIPDYTGEDLALLMSGHPDVLAHNVEVVERLQRRVRDPRCSFVRSLDTLRGAKRADPEVLTKSSLMLGLGERGAEVREALERLREAEVDFLTLGQYLRPTANHAPVARYVEPECFEEWGRIASDLGFANVASGPLVRSSYKAGELFATRIIEARRRRAGTERELE